MPHSSRHPGAPVAARPGRLHPRLHSRLHRRWSGRDGRAEWAVVVGCLGVAVAALAPAIRMTGSPLPVGAPAAAAATRRLPAGAKTTAVAPAVSVGPGEAPAALVVRWDPGDARYAGGPAAVDLDAVSPGGAVRPDPSGAPVRSVPVAPGLTGVAVLGLAPANYVAVVTVTGAEGTRRLAPSAPFRVGPDGSLVQSPTTGGGVGAAKVGTDGVCLGAGYGVGAVSVDGWAGVQGSYCLPPTFATGTGAWCVDHGLDYPEGAYHWASAVVGGAMPLVSQYDRVAQPGEVGRLAWIVSTFGGTLDPARSVAVGIIAHAVMGDYPGLSTVDLDPPQLRVAGGDPGAIVADVASMWSASAAGAGPDRASLQLQAGPYLVGRTYRGTVTVTGASGGPVAGAAISLSASSAVRTSLEGAGAEGAAPTDAAGAAAFSFTPLASTFTLDARTGPLPADTLTLWTPRAPPVAVQRVVTAGPPATAETSLHLVSSTPAQATLVKASSDPHWLPVGAGFTFAVSAEGPGGTWGAVARRTTAPDGTMAPVGGLPPGAYRVTEVAHPPAFQAGGPWTFSLVAGQRAVWQVVDQVVPRPVRVVKLGDDPSLPAVAAGVTFALSSDRDGDGRFATPDGTLRTAAAGVTPTVLLAPGRYRLAETSPPPGYQPAAPFTFAVPPVGASGARLQTIEVTDHAIPGVVRLVKTDAVTGGAVAGAVLAMDRLPSATAAVPIGTWSSGPVPVDVALAPGRYLLREIRPPAGYLADAEPEQIDLLPGQTLVVTFTDRPIPRPTHPPATTPPRPPTPTAPAPTPAPSTPAPTAPVQTVALGPPARVPAPSQVSTLAFTGLAVWRWLVVAAAALAAGGLLVASARRRPLP